MTVLDRPDWRGAFASALLPLILASLVYSLLQATGITHGNPAFTRMPFDPTGSIAALAWILIFGFYGITRWHTAIDGPEGERTSRLVVALMAWALVYTLIAGRLDHFWLEVVNIGSLLFGCFVASRVIRLSRLIAAWLVPGFLWKLVAVLLGIAPVFGFSFH